MNNLDRFHRQQADAAARLRAELDRDPLQKAMAAAMAPTKAEQAALEAAQAAVAAAEQEAGAALGTLARAEDALRSVHRNQRPAAAHAALPSLRVDVAEAKSNLQVAIRRRNQVAASIEVARFERRRAAKAKHLPTLSKPTPPRQRRAVVVDRPEAA